MFSFHTAVDFWPYIQIALAQGKSLVEVRKDRVRAYSASDNDLRIPLVFLEMFKDTINRNKGVLTARR